MLKKEEKMIYIDLDGVLADFNGKVLEIMGKYPHQVTPKELWKTLEHVDNFYYSLDIIEGSKEFLETILYINNINVEILTALPSPSKKLRTSSNDKIMWVYDKLDPYIITNCVSNWRMKSYYCRNDDDILIDDQEKNIVNWQETGGIGILHNNFEDTMQKLKELNVIM